MRLLAAATLPLLAATGAASAEPVTYQGTLGKAAIVAEFTRDPADGLDGIAGRYFYRKVGGDIPLRESSDGRLIEEEPCAPDACPEAGSGPDGAAWEIASEDGGKTLSGRWRGAKTLPIRLSRVGERAVADGEQPPSTPQELLAHSVSLTFAGRPITLGAEPYDALRLDADYSQEAGGERSGGTFAYAVDPRTKFRFPRVERLADGSDPAAANAALAARQGSFSLDAFGCLAGRYAGFADPGNTRFEGGGTLSGYDSEFSTEVSALVGRALSWTESGSLFCGGAGPSNFITSQTMDLRTGKLLETGDILLDFADGAPGEGLLRFVREKRPAPASEDDKRFDADCAIDERLSEALAARFGEDASGEPTLVFALEGLPNVIAACEGDLFSLPLRNAEPWLKPEALALVSR